MKLIIVHHLSHSLAVAAGLASKTEHMEPYVGATFGKVVGIRALFDAKCYTPVAVCRGGDRPIDDCEAAFSVTQHIDESWNDPEVCKRTLVVPMTPRARSTSIGDVMEVTESNMPSSFYALSDDGFKLL